MPASDSLTPRLRHGRTSTIGDSKLNDVTQAVGTVQPPVRISMDRHDEMRLVTGVGAAGLVIAVLMAVFGLPPIDIHGPLHHLGIMDPLCGGTRAARLTAQGHLAAAWRYNPLGILATAAAACAVVRLAIGLVSRRWINLRVAWTTNRARILLIVAAVAFIALDIRQQGRADLLMRPY